MAGNQNPIASSLGGSKFGSSLAINNNFLAIGADTATTTNNNLVRSGNAFLYRFISQGWIDVSARGGDVSSLPHGSLFGWSVALNDTYLAVGARSVSSVVAGQQIFSGDAYLYHLLDLSVFNANCTTGTAQSWCRLSASDNDLATAGNQNPIADCTRPPSQHCFFGSAVGLSQLYVFVGDIGRTGESGSVHAFRLDGSAHFNAANCLTTGATLGPWCNLNRVDTARTELNQVGNNFGAAIAVSGNRVAIGAPNYDYAKPTTSGDNNAGNVFILDLLRLLC